MTARECVCPTAPLFRAPEGREKERRPISRARGATGRRDVLRKVGLFGFAQ